MVLSATMLSASVPSPPRLRPITHRDGCPTLPPSIELHRSFDEDCANAAADGTPIARRPVTPDLTAAYMTQSIMPQNANTLHITFGGQVGGCLALPASSLQLPGYSLPSLQPGCRRLKPSAV